MKQQTEKQVVKSCHTYLKRNGWIVKTVYLGGIPLGGGTLATNPLKGFPDAMCFHLDTKRFLLIEFKKTVGGKLSDDQIYFHKLLRHVGLTVIVVNSLKSLKEQLCELAKKELT
jgi:hypothetical protein